jgi:exodeoxyribonuclease III
MPLLKKSGESAITISMKLVSWNVNGIRACGRGGFSDWFGLEKADVVCVQEVKAFPEQVDELLRNPGKYHSYWHCAQKPGYSGVAIFSKKEPLQVTQGIGIPEFDREGRVLIAEYPGIVVINAYFPNSQRDHARLGYKLQFCKRMLEFCNTYVQQGKHVVLCGDFNIAHQEIDLKNPKSNMNNAGFLPEERAWMSQFLEAGYVDTFREFEKGGGHYTWWSYRPGVREKNIGWRLDYHVVNSELRDRLKSAEIRCDVRGSDHCPVVLNLRD